MRMNTKIWLIIAAVLIILGGIIFTVTMTGSHWDFKNLSSSSYETNTYQISESFTDISMNTNTADIRFLPSGDDTTSVVFYESQNERHSAAVVDGILTIDIVDNRSLLDYIGFNFDVPQITVYLPAGEYASLSIREDTGDIEIPGDFKFHDMDIQLSTGDVKSYASVTEFLKIRTSTGDINMEGFSAGNIELSTSTGKILITDVDCAGDITITVSTGDAKINNCRCKNLTSTGSTGDIILHQVIASETFSIRRSTGDVTFEDADAAEIFVKTDTGDVMGSLLTAKVFITTTNTGSVHVPKSVSGGTCDIITDTGDIEVRILN